MNKCSFIKNRPVIDPRIMQKREFEDILGRTISLEDYRIVERAYMHPCFMNDPEARTRLASMLDEKGIDFVRNIAIVGTAHVRLYNEIVAINSPVSTIPEKERVDIVNEKVVAFEREWQVPFLY